MKTCTRCGETKSLDAFSPNKSNRRDGRHSQCKKCVAFRARERRAANREEYNRRDREWRAANREERNRQQRERRAANREEHNRRNREWRAANREEYNRQQRERRAAYAARTDEQIAADRARLRKGGRKRCRKCRERLPFDAFWDNRYSPDGLCVACCACANRGLRDIAEPYWQAHGIDPDICAWCGAPAEHVDHIKLSGRGC